MGRNHRLQFSEEFKRDAVTQITERVVDTAETGSKDYIIWDDKLPELSLSVFVSGIRSHRG